MNVLLLEDEYPAAERLQRLLRQAAPEAQVLSVLDSVAGALTWLATNPAPDLILSDIQLADGLSLEVFEQAVVRSPVIFTTAYDAYAIRGLQGQQRGLPAETGEAHRTNGRPHQAARVAHA